MAEHQNDDPPEIDLTDESDRGCVLVASALLEECLENRFRRIFDSKKIPKNVQDSLFVSNGPLATFAAKIKVAYAVGLTIKQTFDDLEAVRRLRNGAAHAAKDFDFSNQVIAHKIDSLKCVGPWKTKMTRYSFESAKAGDTKAAGLKDGRSKTHSEARARLAGYLKYHKSLFALGIQNLLMEIRSGMSIAQVEALLASQKEILGKEKKTEET